MLRGVGRYVGLVESDVFGEEGERVGSGVGVLVEARECAVGIEADLEEFVGID